MLAWMIAAKAAPVGIEQLIGIGIGVGVILILLLIIFIKSNLVICEPNEVVVISGRARKLKDGTVVGYRLLKGGRGFKWPIYETVKRLSLNNIPIELKVNKILAEGLIPIHIHGLANVKIAGNEEEGLPLALERFLGRNIEQISKVARETIDGNLRGVIANVSPEEANAKRIEIAEQVSTYARQDLKRLGLVLDFFKIQEIADSQGYLEAIGRKRNAEVLKEAQIAEATAQADARSISAQQRQKGKVAEAEAEMAITDAENRLAVHQADLQAKTNQAEERAKVAGRLARIVEEKELEQARVDRNRKRHEANTVIPAEAQKQAEELKAEGDSARILHNGKATAEAIRLMREQWEDGKTRELFLIQLLPELLEHITSVIADNLHIEKLTVLDSGQGEGLPTYFKGLTGSAVSVLEQLKNATGMDLPDLLQKAAENGEISPTALPKEKI